MIGWAAAAAGIAFGLALGLLMAFFVTKDARFDRMAERLFVVFAVLAIPTIVAVNGRLDTGGVAGAAVAIVGAAGVAALGLGEFASSLRLVDFRRIAAAMTLGFLAFLAWIGLVSLLVVTGGSLPVGLGWLGVVTIVAGGAIVVWVARQPGVMTGKVEPGRPQVAAFLVPLVGIVGWMVWLGASL